MKTSIRFLSLLFAVLLIAGAALTASADNTDKASNEQALNFLVKLGVFGGYEDGSLKPDNKVERDEMAKIIYTLYNTFTDAGNGSQVFADVPADDWSAGYVAWCSAKDIIGGYGNGKFGPNDYVTYDQALKMICGALGYNQWDSSLWPTDVRMKALNQLELGENLDGINGSDYVTRAQIAQMVYNAFGKPMNETRKNAYGQEIPLTLKNDIWKVTEESDVVIATENFYNDRLANATTDKEDVIVLNINGTVTLEDIALEEYKGKTDELIFSEVTIIKRGGKAIGTTVDTKIIDGVKIGTNKDGKLYVGDITVDDAAIYQWIFNGDKVQETAAYAPVEEFAYTASMYERAETDDAWAIWTYLQAYEVRTVGNKTTTFAPLALVGVGNTITIDNDRIASASALAEDDVVILAVYGNSVKVVDVVKPITESVTKFGNGKITFGGKEYDVNKAVFNNVATLALTNDVLGNDANGEAKTFDFYVYDGKVFYAPNTETAVEGYNFAVLAYVNEPSTPVIDPVTQTYSAGYTAVLVINGKETKVDLNATETIIDVDGSTLAIANADNQTAILSAYGRNINANGYLVAPYTLVTYTVDKNGYYTINLLNTANTDYAILEKDADISYNEKLGGFKIEGTDVNGAAFNESIVVTSDATTLYYTYVKEETGDHKYLGIYTNATIPANFAPVKTEGYTYLVKGQNDELYTLVTSMLADELAVEVESGDYLNDARLLVYSYAASEIELVVEKKDTFYTYSLMDMATLKNGEVETHTKKSIAEGATNMIAAGLYAWDDAAGKYVQITAQTEGLNSVTATEIVDVYNDVIFTKDGSEYENGVKVPASAIVWTATSNSAYKQLDSAALTTLVNKAKDKGVGVRALVLTYLDSNGEKQISSIIVEDSSKVVHDTFGA